MVSARRRYVFVIRNYYRARGWVEWVLYHPSVCCAHHVFGGARVYYQLVVCVCVRGIFARLAYAV